MKVSTISGLVTSDMLHFESLSSTNISHAINVPLQVFGEGVAIQKVLVVDDAVSNRKMAMRLLQRNGCDCYEAEDGQQAIDVMNKLFEEAGVDHSETTTPPVQLVLMDAEMPVLKGPDAIRRLRGLGYTNTIMIGVSGNVLPEDVSVFLEQGADGVLPKPLKLEALVETIDRIQKKRKNFKSS